jgi:hypothetical protein
MLPRSLIGRWCQLNGITMSYGHYAVDLKLSEPLWFGEWHATVFHIHQ